GDDHPALSERPCVQPDKRLARHRERRLRDATSGPIMTSGAWVAPVTLVTTWKEVEAVTVDREQLADCLKTRREALQPEDVGLPRGARRRTHGLRREEVAALCGMSADYYSRIEQQRGSRPSEQMLAAIARGLHLSLDERDHLFRLAGYPTPARELRLEHVDAGLMRVLDRLQDTPAQVVTSLGETLLQTPPAVALLGDETAYIGPDRSL